MTLRVTTHRRRQSCSISIYSDLSSAVDICCNGEASDWLQGIASVGTQPSGESRDRVGCLGICRMLRSIMHAL